MTEPERPEEVARMLMPLHIRHMDRLLDYLEAAYGKGLSMRQVGEWMVFERAPEH